MNAFRARKQASGRIDLLPPEPAAATRPQGRRSPAHLEVVDADFVVIRTDTARTTNDNHRPARHAVRSPVPRNLMFRIGAAGAGLCEAGLQLLSGRAFAGLVAASFVFVFAYAGGLSALRAALPTAGQGKTLHIADVTTAIDDRNGMKVLSVYGRLDNASDGIQAVPPLEVRVEGNGRTIRRRVALDTQTIGAGGSQHFAVRIPHDGGKVPKVVVSLVPKGAPAD